MKPAVFEYAGIVKEAEIAGRTAALKCRPHPMIVYTPTGLFDDSIDITKPIYKIDDGACGFAWIVFAGNTPFGRWAKKNKIATKHYPSGLSVWVSEFGQSVERKAAYAGAYAKVLRAHGIECHAGDRLD